MTKNSKRGPLDFEPTWSAQTIHLWRALLDAPSDVAFQVVTKSLSNGADFKAKNSFGVTLFILAVSNDTADHDILSVFFDQGVLPDEAAISHAKKLLDGGSTLAFLKEKMAGVLAQEESHILDQSLASAEKTPSLRM